MSWNEIEGQWHQVKGQLKSRWSKLTDSDIQNAAGKKEQLVGILQERYGILADRAEHQIDAWIAELKPESKREPEPKTQPNPNAS